MLADRGYDSLANHKFLCDLSIIPIIHIREPTYKGADGEGQAVRRHLHGVR